MQHSLWSRTTVGCAEEIAKEQAKAKALGWRSLKWLTFDWSSFDSAKLPCCS